MGPQSGQAGCLTWAAPDLSRFPCGGTIPSETLDSWLPIATQMVFGETGQRFPGVTCTATVVVCDRGGGCRVSGGPDLFQSIRYPVLELTAVSVDGVEQPDLLDHYRVDGGRWLTPVAPYTWPTEVGTTFTVRYGRTPPPMVVKARDQLLWELVMSNDPPIGENCSSVQGVTTLTENGRTITLEPGLVGTALLAWCRRTYRRTRGSLSQVVDLADAHYAPQVRLVIPEQQLIEED